MLRFRRHRASRLTAWVVGSFGLAVSAFGTGCGGDDFPLVEDWRDQIVYEVIVDRFDDGDSGNNTVDGVSVVPGALERFQGGDWRGLTRRLGYLQRLGITAIWISPIVANVQRTEGQDGYHGYWAKDFTTLNARFGDLDDLRALVDGAHARGMRVIVDVVTNHTGRVFFYDLNGDGVLSSDAEWYPPFEPDGPYPTDEVVWTEPPPRLFSEEGGEMVPWTLEPKHFHLRGQMAGYVGDARELTDFPTGLRDLHTEDERVIEGLIDTYVYWAESIGFDGFRLDAVPHVNRAFWTRFCTEVRARLRDRGIHDFLLLGEVYDDDPEVLASYTNDGQFDSVFDFSLKWRAIDALLLDGAPASLAREALVDNRAYYPDTPHENGVGLTPWQARMSFADNHDMWRIAAAIDDPWIPILAFTLVYTVDAIPVLYYGSEHDFIGIGGDTSRERLWTTGFDESNWMYRYLARLAELRQSSVALRRGDLIVRYASEASTAVEYRGDDSTDEDAPGTGTGSGTGIGTSSGSLSASDASSPGSQASVATPPDAGLLVYERRFGDEVVLVALNANARREARAQVDTSFSEGTRLRDALFGEDAGRVGPHGRFDVVLPARSVAVLFKRP
ncbi:MAG: hypothetical protein H6729_14775 [Deltaproteobacteria bacterium]|nr:hypothetical protein [Deltaproteobacteria bacterium]